MPLPECMDDKLFPSTEFSMKDTTMKNLQIGIGIFICSVHILCAQVPLAPVSSEQSSVASNLEVGSALKHDVSPALRNISPLLEPADLGNREIFRGIPHPNSNATSPDGAVQTSVGPRVGTTSGLNVLGVGQGFVGPQG